MKAIIFHGTGGSPDSNWIPYIKEGLEKKGYEVVVPSLPNSDNPNLKDSLQMALALPYDSDTILIGHSSGASLILSVLENIDAKVRQAILVAGFFEPLNSPEPEPMVQEVYDWEKIKLHCQEFIFINSDNDPWGCTDKVGSALQERLGGKLIVATGQGHMGSEAFNQPYKEFPSLLSLIK
jgi:uncharacterized protein